MPLLSERVGSACYAKRDDSLPGFSSNLRGVRTVPYTSSRSDPSQHMPGVYNRLFNLTPDEKAKGAASTVALIICLHTRLSLPKTDELPCSFISAIQYEQPFLQSSLLLKA